MSWRRLLPDDATIYDTALEVAGREEWGEGPWNDEPDKISWTDPATGRPCLIHRGPGGALCGYVAVDPGHPLHGVGCGDVLDGLAVHGGVTYASLCRDSADESFGICHVPAPGAPHDVWWLGFHCANGFDIEPTVSGFLRRQGLAPGLLPDSAYRDVGYVIEQCQLLAAQLVAVGRS
jgi:hypothetical protein